ncbi:Protein of unknown function [Mucilaginibacter gossypiicola]|uniref:DUF3891 domain-containing protein n=1 Tax=Mucilaginibacter gossypiicola TaxID=551995 RepID=A0A1H8UAJ4_9SPHI|nr:DUF3891 family protein [Mucilaginibacter gossypiicola]SEO99658.1 Protein of unknown function [Mucilaginibacter gossypiicola]
MIVNYTEAGWEIVTQRAHGLLAAQIAQQWKQSARTKRWMELLMAIAEHDDAQIELERNNLLTPQGGPVDFKMKVFEQRHCTQTMDFALSKSRYIALLCSIHLDFVYGAECMHHAQGRAFLQEQKKLQKRWQKELGMSLAEAQRDYRLLEWCDALSLLLCQHGNQPEARAVEISQGPDKRDYQLVQSADQTLTVRPWPFVNPGFELSFETRLIPQLAFKNSAEFRSAFLEAEVTEKRWTFKRD